MTIWRVKCNWRRRETTLPHRPTLGTMALWGLLGYHDPVELQTVYKRAADWVVSIQSNDPAHALANVGRWSSGYNATWFDNDISMSTLNLSNLRRTDVLLRTNGITAVPTYVSQPIVASKPTSSRGFLATSLDGNQLYYTDRSNVATGRLCHQRGRAGAARAWRIAAIRASRTRPFSTVARIDKDEVDSSAPPPMPRRPVFTRWAT